MLSIFQSIRVNSIRERNRIDWFFSNLLQMMRSLGTDGVTKTDEFSEKFQREGGGIIFNPKIYIADFGPLNRAFQHENDTKGSFQGMFSTN